MENIKLAELTSLFFTTRQIIKQQLPQKGNHDPNAWLRLETMCFISKSENPTMQDVANYLRVKAPSATSLVGNLAKDGLIARKKGNGDKRVVRISLTPQGKKMIQGYKARSAATMRKVFSRLEEREINELISILRHVRDIHQV